MLFKLFKRNKKLQPKLTCSLVVDDRPSDYTWEESLIQSTTRINKRIDPPLGVIPDAVLTPFILQQYFAVDISEGVDTKYIARFYYRSSDELVISKMKVPYKGVPESHEMTEDEMVMVDNVVLKFLADTQLFKCTLAYYVRYPNHPKSSAMINFLLRVANSKINSDD